MSARPAAHGAEGWAALAVAVLRVMLVVVAFALDRLILEPSEPNPGLEVVLALGLAYAAVSVQVSRRHPARPPGGWDPWVAADVLFIAAGTYATGGASSELRHLLVAAPLVAAFVGSARRTLLATLAVLVAYLTVAAAQPADATLNEVAGHLLLLTWPGALACVFAAALSESRQRLEALANDRLRLLLQVQAAEERERREIAYRLHDDPVQSLHAAQLELSRARRGRPGALDHARSLVDAAVDGLRMAIAQLRPDELDRAGLDTALRGHAQALADRTGQTISLALDPGAQGHRDELVYALGRELLTNAARHSGARRVHLALERERERLLLRVRDDGRGLDPGCLRAALDGGHVGLTACRERVEAEGGTLTLDGAPGAGTEVVACLPVPGSTAGTG
jgi:two-component system NarL family sensor kinase